MKFALIFQSDTAAFLPGLFLAISLLVVLLHGSFLGVSAASLHITMEGHQSRSRLVIIHYFWTKSSRLRYNNNYIDKLS